MEEEKKDNNENANINIENDDRIEELDKNIYKQRLNEQNDNSKDKIKENNNSNNIIKENEERKYIVKDQIINNENNSKIIELTDEIEKIKKEKESLEEQKKELEEKNNKLSEENIKLITKLKTLKESILKLKECLEKDIYIKLESKTKCKKIY